MVEGGNVGGRTLGEDNFDDKNEKISERRRWVGGRGRKFRVKREQQRGEEILQQGGIMEEEEVLGEH